MKAFHHRSKSLNEKLQRAEMFVYGRCRLTSQLVMVCFDAESGLLMSYSGLTDSTVRSIFSHPYFIRCMGTTHSNTWLKQIVKAQQLFRQAYSIMKYRRF